MVGRIREALEKYTYDPDDLHDSILDDNEPVIKPYTRMTAAAFLFFGFFIFLGAGILIGDYIDVVALSVPTMFSSRLGPEFVFYPPIFVLFVDMVHSVASRVE